MAMADGDEKAHRRHRYPTRWNLRRHTHTHAAFFLTSKVENKAKNQVRVACKRRKEESHPFNLPREIVFDILVLIPAEVLHEVVRYVCKQWYDIVSDPLFIEVHCQMSSAGFLIQGPREIRQAYYIEANTTSVKITESEIPFPANILGSFNGLVLFHDLTAPEIYHVMNLVTKEKISLPPLVGLKRNCGVTGFALTSLGHYKVVCVSGEACDKQLQMSVFTMGVDRAWRFIDLQGVPMTSEVKETLLYRPCFIAGLLYWYHTTCFTGFALDVDTETIYRFSEPDKDLFLDARPAKFLSMGTCLGLIKAGEGIWRLWKLTDAKSGEWSEMAGVNMQVVLSRVDKIFYPSECFAFCPVSLINGYIWFYRLVNKEFIVVRYNLTDGIFVFSRIKTLGNSTLFHSHVHTLLSPQIFYPWLV